MNVFVDFEASSLSDDSYPIEVGWVFEDGSGAEDYLIRPAPGWTDWDPAAEAVHRISRARLEAEGTSHEEVANRMLHRLQGSRILATAPSWDGRWLSVLLRAAGLPRHALRLSDSDDAHLQAAREILSESTPPTALGLAALAVVSRVQDQFAGETVRHRALDDAEQERRIWQAVRREARRAGGGTAST